MSFIKELKRRNVFRSATAYLVISWLLVQILGIAASSFEAPAWVMKMFITLLALGFIPAILFSWAFEFTEDGIKKEKNRDTTSKINQSTAIKLDYITLAACVLILGLFIYQQIRPTSSSLNVTQPKIELKVSNNNDSIDSFENIKTAQIDNSQQIKNKKSIAVLPFLALSNDESDEYFGKGIAEELLNSLAQFPELKVAARTSAFSFGNKDVDLREVGEKLDVAYVLEGSVRNSGEKLRITAQLIRSIDGFHIWSEVYERNQTDIFVIQDEIVSELSRILQFQLGVGVGSGRAARVNINPRAYNEYLRGLNFWWLRSVSGENRRKAIKAFSDATQFDENFADAWSALGVSLALSSGNSTNIVQTREEKESLIHTAFARAIVLDQNNVRAHAGAAFKAVYPIDIAGQYLRKAISLAPNDPLTNYSAALHYYLVGDHINTIKSFENALSLDPLNQTIVHIRNMTYGGIGQHSQILTELKPKAMCDEGSCKLQNALNAYSGLVIALQAKSQKEIAYFSERFNATIPAWGDISGKFSLRVSILNNFAKAYLGKSKNKKFWASIKEAPISSGVSVLFWSSMLAQHGRTDLALEALKSESESYYSIVSDNVSLYPLLPGAFEMPESIRRDPIYHELWSRPQLKKLADARRKNGADWGLPLPIIKE